VITAKRDDQIDDLQDGFLLQNLDDNRMPSAETSALITSETTSNKADPQTPS